jgi:serine/threonine protein kinase
MELLEANDLFEYVQHSDRCFPVPLARYYFRQLLSGVQQMHAKDIFHRDLKLDNLMI